MAKEIKFVKLRGLTYIPNWMQKRGVCAVWEVSVSLQFLLTDKTVEKERERGKKVQS